MIVQKSKKKKPDSEFSKALAQMSETMENIAVVLFNYCYKWFVSALLFPYSVLQPYPRVHVL